jgi:hypothetical protein
MTYLADRALRDLLDDMERMARHRNGATSP